MSISPFIEGIFVLFMTISTTDAIPQKRVIPNVAHTLPLSEVRLISGSPKSARKSVSSNTSPDLEKAIRSLNPPQQEFFAKQLDYQGIPIKSAAVVSDIALVEAYHRLDTMLQHLPDVVYNLHLAGAELHIIGKNQVTSDLPDYRELKGKKIPEYGGQTVDERTRGLGGLHTSCGEENLLKLAEDRYRGRDICIHEFAHNIQGEGISEDVRDVIRQQYKKSTIKGLWKGSYAGSNEYEFFAELTMWYFGTHGDMGMTGKKPAAGPKGLKAYDADAYKLLDDFYSGRIEVQRVRPKTA